MSHVVSGIENAVSNVVHDVGSAVTNPSALLGTAFGFGIGGAGGLTGGTAAGNIATGQPVGAGLQNAGLTDLLGLGAGAGLAGAMAPGAAGVGVDTGAGVDIYGNPIQSSFVGGPGTAGAGDFAGAAGGAGLSASTIANLGSAASRLLGGGGAAGGGSNPFMNFLTGAGGGPSLPSLAPGLAALQYARQQNPVDTSQLTNTYNAAAANAPAFIQAAQAPLQQAQAGGYGDILQSQGLRGIRGSSFGDQDIANYINTTNQGIANAGTNAAESALGLQGQLASQITNAGLQNQLLKNSLYGRAFSMLGQGLSPTPGMGGMGGGAPGGAGGGGIPGIGGAGGFLSNLNLGGVGNAFGNALSGIGSGMGSLFGSPGSSIWGTAPIQGMPTDYLGSLAGF